MEHRPLAEQVSDKLIQYIIDNDIRAGHKLPNEMELARLLHVGRSTIREAVKLLASRNVLDVRQGSGTFVVEQRIGISSDPFGIAFIKDRSKLTNDLLEIRIIIEPRIAGMAAMNAEADDIIILSKICDEVEELLIQDKDHTQKDIEFHGMIAKCSKNLVAPNLMPTIQAAISLFIDSTHSVLKEETIKTHRAILDAIRSHNPLDAQDAMLLHLVYNRDFLRNYPQMPTSI